MFCCFPFAADKFVPMQNKSEPSVSQALGSELHLFTYLFKEDFIYQSNKCGTCGDLPPYEPWEWEEKHKPVLLHP